MKTDVLKGAAKALSPKHQWSGRMNQLLSCCVAWARRGTPRQEIIASRRRRVRVRVRLRPFRIVVHADGIRDNDEDELIAHPTSRDHRGHF